MPSEPTTTPAVVVPDNFTTLASLFELPRSSPTRIIEGELQFQGGAGVVYALAKLGAPAPAAGINIPADNGRLFGPNSPWNLDNIWVKQKVPGGGTQAIFAGWVERSR